MTKPHSLLPPTPWQAKTCWSLERKPLIVLLIGLTFCGLGEAMLILANLGAAPCLPRMFGLPLLMLILANLGAAPWAVFAQGLAKLLGMNIGITTLMISMVVMLLWIPLHLRAGFGTLANIAVIALVLGLVVQFVPAPSVDNWLLRGLLCVGGVGVIGVAAALYLTCHMGAGPRDGLMVGLCHKTGWRVGVVRSLLESTVCGVGWLFGGTVGVGTLLFAFGVGWVVQMTLLVLQRWFAK